MRERDFPEACDSTEDMLNNINEVNNRIVTTEDDVDNRVIMSMDAEALFPSLNIKDILKGIWNLIMETDIKIVNVDVMEMAKYLAVSYEK